jgi:hypothetical protein
VGVALRRTISDTAEQAQITWWLNGVEIYLRGRLGDVTLLDEDIVKYVEVEVVAEKVRRSGRDESSITVSIGGDAVTRRYENPVTADDITDDMWGLFTPDLSGSAYTIAVSSPLDIA